MDPVEDQSELPGICPACYKKLAIENGLPEVSIPERLGHCDILKVHGDGDLTVKCGGKKIIVTKEGETFSEDTIPPVSMDLTPEEEMQV
jgi:hypothetical protein